MENSDDHSFTQVRNSSSEARLLSFPEAIPSDIQGSPLPWPYLGDAIPCVSEDQKWLPAPKACVYVPYLSPILDHEIIY